MYSGIRKSVIGNAKKWLATAALLLGAVQMSSAAAEVLQIGGVGNVRFMDSTHGYAASGAGTWAALSFEVTSMDPQPDGSVIAGMVHDFVTPVGGWVRTEDVVIMQPIPDSPGVFSLAVTYNIFEAGNGMEGFEGQSFNSRGFIDTNRGIASVRYEGMIRRDRDDDSSDD